MSWPRSEETGGARRHIDLLPLLLFGHLGDPQLLLAPLLQVFDALLSLSFAPSALDLL